MEPLASVIVPTRARPGYLDVALASILPQARAAGAEVLVVDDGPDVATRAVAARHGARYVPHDRPLGLNDARNTGIDAARSDVLAFVDDDVAVHPGWLRALVDAAAQAGPDVGVLTGPIRARFEDHPLRACGREGPPITWQDLGRHDTDARHAWGANMTVLRRALERAGRFDAGYTGAGDEEAWQRRLLAAGGRIRYVAAAGVDHRRAGDDARLRSLARAARVRGREARRFDERRAEAPGLVREGRVLAGCLVHAGRRRCANGLVLAAHSAGRLEAALERAGEGAAPQASCPGAPPQQSSRTVRAQTGSTALLEDDFLSGTSGTVGGKRGALRRAADLALDAVVVPRRAATVRRARSLPRRSVLVLGVERPGLLMDAARAELRRSRHDVIVRTRSPGTQGKFANLNALLGEHDPGAHDWLLVVDDDVVLPRGFLDAFLALAEEAGLLLAQPAHRLFSHAAWPVTRRRARSLVRRSAFVEIGPVTAFHATAFDALLPFPDLVMGWGLDAHWSAVAREESWPLGIVDATPVGHTLAPAAQGYSREAAVAEARAFLADRPYVTREEAAWSRRVR
ncbi:MAG: glycosyltransferase [Solirubrobacteraceae bacterium MAG38_C4-C5]|nr:glycosyltransferase [Candidatus Siliceabacter maunaloa]